MYFLLQVSSKQLRICLVSKELLVPAVLRCQEAPQDNLINQTGIHRSIHVGFKKSKPNASSNLNQGQASEAFLKLVLASKIFILTISTKSELADAI